MDDFKSLISRRTFFSWLFESFSKILGFSALFGSAHALMGFRPGEGLYPATKRPYYDKNPRGVVRPPGALPEKDFLSACIRCSRCQLACDYGAIRYFKESEGKNYQTPYIDASKGACNLCTECTQICPTDALKPLTKKDRKDVRMATVALDPNRCLSHKAKRLRNQQGLLTDLGRDYREVDTIHQRRGICGECMMVCPRRGKAIKYEPGYFLAPKVFPDECLGCGLCEEICRAVLRDDSPAMFVVPTRELT